MTPSTPEVVPASRLAKTTGPVEHPVVLAHGRPQKAMACPTSIDSAAPLKDLSNKCKNSRALVPPSPYENVLLRAARRYDVYGPFRMSLAAS